MLKLISSRNPFVAMAILFMTALPILGGSPHASNAATEIAPLNWHINKFVKNYIQINQNSLHKIRQRSGSPFNLIDSVMTRYGLPVQLKYLAVIESELKTTAVSPVGAVGPWQLMPETANILGLKTGRFYDERRNYYKSTRAAARYLKDLHAEFGDWLLVLAAYNGGPGPVYSAMRRSGSRNFWILQRYLPEETREHVKKFIATSYYFEGPGSLAILSKVESNSNPKMVTLTSFSGKTPLWKNNARKI